MSALARVLQAAWLVLALLCVSLAALPPRYIATAQVLLPSQGDGKSRMRTLRGEAAQSVAAEQNVRQQLLSISDKRAIVIDEPAVRAKSDYRWLAAPGLLLLLAFFKHFFDLRSRRARAPDRAVVREAVMLAQRGHKTAVVDTGSSFRVVLADNAPDRAQLRVLARLSGGALVLARRR